MADTRLAAAPPPCPPTLRSIPVNRPRLVFSKFTAPRNGKDMASMHTVQINPERTKNILGGHPWIFSGALQRKPDAPDGSLVRVLSNKQFLGIGYYNSRTDIAVRMLSLPGRGHRCGILRRAVPSNPPPQGGMASRPHQRLPRRIRRERRPAGSGGGQVRQDPGRPIPYPGHGLSQAPGRRGPGQGLRS